MSLLLAERLADVAAPEQILALLQDRRNDRIVAQDSILLYTDPASGKQTLFNGLLPVLASVFWPDDANKSRKKALEQAKKRAKQNAKHTPTGVRLTSSKDLSGPVASRKAAVPPGHFATGLMRGSRVHKQFEDAHLLDEANFQRKYGSLAPDTRALFKAFDDYGIISVAPEFCDYDEDLQMAVRHDGVGVKCDGTVVFTEHKTGSRHCFGASSGIPLAGSLRGVIDDSEQSRALLQLTVAVLITMRKRPYLTNIEAYVFRPTDETGTGRCVVKPYQLSLAFINTYGPLIYNDILAHRKAEGKLRGSSSSSSSSSTPVKAKKRTMDSSSGAIFDKRLGKKPRGGSGGF